MVRMHELGGLLVAGAREVVRPGESDLPGAALVRLGRVVLTLVIVTTNLIGACSVLLIAELVVPLPPVAAGAHVRLVNALAALGYVAVSLPVGAALGIRGMLRLRKWLLEERPATLEEARIVLQAPLRLFLLQVSLWLVAAAVFSALNATYSGALALRVAVIIVLTGMVTASCAYLLTELLLRPAAVRALAHGAPGRLAVPGVATRAVLAWMFGTGLTVFGVVAIGILALNGDPGATPRQLGIAMVVLGGTGIAVGMLAVTVAARATADPVESVVRALSEVQRGNFDVRVPV
jgi:adenylate cyclase